MVAKRIYIAAFLLTAVAFAAAFLAVKAFDDSKLGGIQSQVLSSAEQTEETRLLFVYSQVFTSDNSTQLCKFVDYNLKRQMDRGYFLVRRLRDLEKANLLADYDSTRKAYYLNNFEIWLDVTQAAKQCASGPVTPVLFFTKTKTLCTDCIVQGDVLDSLRGECKNLRVITLADDLDIAPISLAKETFGVADSPSLVVNNQQVLPGLQSREAILSKIRCEK